MDFPCAIRKIHLTNTTSNDITWISHYHVSGSQPGLRSESPRELVQKQIP